MLKYTKLMRYIRSADTPSRPSRRLISPSQTQQAHRSTPSILPSRPFPRKILGHELRTPLAFFERHFTPTPKHNCISLPPLRSYQDIKHWVHAIRPHKMHFNISHVVETELPSRDTLHDPPAAPAQMQFETYFAYQISGRIAGGGTAARMRQPYVVAPMTKTLLL